ncbi:TatD family hydrolase [Paenibacillus endoradicis]|uniref:TatD family hydrolase n=1 Tax=Paenibacillus endoradicis TaxID=2972487 RepID=UPI002159B523|nr:TatD family hydrolase [Paenibacillus endoradicis]MCR8656179.1 TatD family hydrolase [Paenibacillus endoradicis]
MATESLKFIDAHIHLEQYSEEDCKAIIERALHHSVKHVVAVSMDLASSERTYKLTQKYGEVIMAAYGHHPEQPLPSEQEEQILMDLIMEYHIANKSFAIGEIGLPYYSALEAREQGREFLLEPYIAFLDRMLALAKTVDRLVVLHAVYEDASIACDLLEKHQIKKAHFHWFKGPTNTIARMIDNGYYISITPDVFVEEEIRELVRKYPLSLMMVETDGPWPFEGPFAGQITEPMMVIDVVNEIAKLKGMSAWEVAETVYNNTLKLYR